MEKCNIILAGEYDLRCTIHDQTALECSREEVRLLNLQVDEVVKALQEEIERCSALNDACPKGGCGSCSMRGARMRFAQELLQTHFTEKQKYLCPKCGNDNPRTVKCAACPRGE